MTEENKFNSEIDSNKKNINNIRCTFCSSLILRPTSSYFTEDEFQLPLPHQKTKTTISDIETELVKRFWTVDDMFTFENIGFSHTVDNYKYLICADCEMGPVGYHNISTKKCYVALERVKYDETPEK